MNKLSQLLNSKSPVFFISPHLDDAIFSAGDLLATLSKSSHPVSVVNVFTAPPPAALTLSAKAFLRQCQAESGASLQAKRVTEDSLVLSRLGIVPTNLNLPEALWREKNHALYNIFPELGAVYPTYRWHISKGSVSPSDAPFLKALSKKLAAIVPKNAYVLAPLGIGNHVDHIVVRDACRAVFGKVGYWADFPYHLQSPLPETFVSQNKLQPYAYVAKKARKLSLMKGYSTQFPAVFPAGISILPEETFYL